MARRWLVRIVLVCVVIAALLGERGVRRDPASSDLAATPDHGTTASSGARTASLRDAAIRPAAITPVVPGPLRLEGLVTDQEDHPVAGARVTLADRVAIAEADGSFAFDGLAEGEYDVTAELGEGFAESQGVRLDATSDPVTLQLARGPTLLVHVVDPANQPIAGAKVSIVSREHVTGADGTVRLRGVAIDDELVVVSAPGHATVRSRVPTSDDPAAIVEKTVTLQGGAEVSGRVVDAAGKPVEEASVDLEPAAGGRSESATTDAQGAWHLPDIGKGHFIARASSSTGIPVADLRIDHDGVHPTTGVILHVEPGGEIAGIVVDPSGRPVADARVGAASIAERTDQDGRFVARGLKPDTYALSVSTPTMGAADHTVVLARGQHLDVKLVVEPSSIAGLVVDARGAPVEDASVMARSEAGYGYDRTDMYGHFDLGGLAPGRYKITAQRDGSRVEGAVVEAATNSRKLRLVVPDPAAVTGRVLLGGVPVPYFGVALVEDPTSTSARPEPVRASDGRFTHKDAELGTFAVVIVGPSFARKVIENVRISSGQITDLGDIAVEAGDHIHGHVTDERGARIAGATVRLAGARGSYGSTGLEGIMEGAPFAVTDARGEFEIAGVAPSSDERGLVASHPALGVSELHALAAGETDIALELHPTGAIDGTILHRSPDMTFVIASRADGRGEHTYADFDGSEAFHVPDLPAGEYRIEVGGHHTLAPLRVTVVGGRTSTIQFEAPEHPVELRVHLAGCSLISLRTVDTDELLALSSCTDGVATFPGAAPRTYQLCPELGDCRPIDIPAVPVHDIQL